MRCLTQRFERWDQPEAVFERLGSEPGLMLLSSSLSHTELSRYSFIVARPFLTFRSAGPRCELSWPGGADIHFGNPWRVLESLLARYELKDEFDLPLPLGGCFGYWGYELKNFLEPRLPQRARDELELPDSVLGFYDSLLAFDHALGVIWIVATGLKRDGSRDVAAAGQQMDFWQEKLAAVPTELASSGLDHGDTICRGEKAKLVEGAQVTDLGCDWPGNPEVFSNLHRSQFIERVLRAKAYIQAGDIYQVNLSQRLSAVCPTSPWSFFRALTGISPAPFSAYLDAGDFQLASSSPELFLRLSGAHIQTRPIKGTRPRATDPLVDSQLSYQLQTSSKELAELVMITDLLRNDLGRVCQFGSIRVPEIARLERFAHVHHLVSTIEGSLRNELTHLSALAACFPGGSITGAPKVRAMEIIDELEPVRRGPYTGVLGYLGFNRESQLSIIIRTVLHKAGTAHFPVGAGIVADSIPEAEYAETLAKARGFVETLRLYSRSNDRVPQRQLRS
ncbi:MAG TPA: aminodeoxychorismate synthase component I [Verrucomicrobiae bacterium]|nr:aminodeoxychorismate synthase component I [Verrucomicrobiae bacterium]